MAAKTPKPELFTIGNNIRKLREECDLSQQELAEKLGLSTYKTVGEWERAVTPPSFDKVMKLCEIFDCDSDYLIGRIEEKTHDIKDVHDLTGLSEKAITKLLNWNKAKDRSRLWVKYLSQMIESKRFDEMMLDITKLVSSAKCWLKALRTGKQPLVADEKDSYDASLLAINRDVSNIANEIAEQEIGG